MVGKSDNLVKREIANYVEREIYPRYNTNNGHGLDHIQNVVRRSLGFAKRINDGDIETTPADFAGLPAELATGKIDYNMSYVIAAFHDLGRLKNNELHHLVSAAYLLDDDFVAEHFSRDQLRVMADAVMDHRASNQLDPLTIYGKIVSSADRDTDYYYMMRRTYYYMKHKSPAATEEEILANAYDKLLKKFGGENAYATKKMYFTNPEYDATVEKFRQLARKPQIFKAEMARALAEES